MPVNRVAVEVILRVDHAGAQPPLPTSLFGYRKRNYLSPEISASLITRSRKESLGEDQIIILLRQNRFYSYGSSAHVERI